MPTATTPVATYRLQFHSGFTFADATAIAGYLHALGISHCYTSNYFMAVPGSQHGYDVADPTRLNPEIGDDTTYRAWIAALRAHGMGHIIDLVPNHMGIARSANPWWQDLLENGESSSFSRVFDVDWHPLKPELEHKVLLPILGAPYGTVLEQREIQLEYADGAFVARYFDQTFPIAPGTYDRILCLHSEQLLNDIGEQSADGMEFLSIVTAITRLPPRTAQDPALREERQREKEIIKRRLATLTGRVSGVMAHVQRAIAELNGIRGQAQTFDALDTLLSAQPYRLSYWRVAAEEINYRRFFDINELAAIRVEDPEVFTLTHGFAFSLLDAGAVDGFRIDHVDGLYDPHDYLRRLQDRTGRQPYVVVEKILGPEEQLPDWPVAGTTGYDFLARINGLFVDSQHAREMNDTYERFTRLKVPFRELAYRGKQLVLRMSMAGELNILAHQLNRFSERNRHYRDFTLNSLMHAMREIIASFPVYRTYVTGHDRVSDRDREYIERAVREAKRRNPGRPGVVFDFVRDLLLKKTDYIPETDRDEHARFIGKFQQVTSPVTAKGIEDTALYIYNRLVSLNDVGGEPEVFGTAPDALHAWLSTRAGQWPHGLSALSTHDTKRSEDVRARINVLSELPAEWRQATTRWARINRRAHTSIEGSSYPSRNEEYLLYQTLIGTWPAEDLTPDTERAYIDRISAYMLKAMREAKVYTSWLNPSELHEQAMTTFVERVLSPANVAFRMAFLPFQRRVAHYGLFNSLAQTALKITAPGVPDFYQGTELWDFSLVDPDNRRPVDYALRAQLLRELTDAAGPGDPLTLIAGLLDDPAQPRLKLFTTMKMLHIRRHREALFRDGGYEPLAAEGDHGAHLFAFRRTLDERQVIVVVPRLIAALSGEGELPLGDVWRDTRLLLPADTSGGHLTQLLTGACVPIRQDEGRAVALAADVFRHFPVAVLERP